MVSGAVACKPCAVICSRTCSAIMVEAVSVAAVLLVYSAETNNTSNPPSPTSSTTIEIINSIKVKPGCRFLRTLFPVIVISSIQRNPRGARGVIAPFAHPARGVYRHGLPLARILILQEYFESDRLVG